MTRYRPGSLVRPLGNFTFTEYARLKRAERRQRIWRVGLTATAICVLTWTGVFLLAYHWP